MNVLRPFFVHVPDLMIGNSAYQASEGREAALRQSLLAGAAAATAAVAAAAAAAWLVALSTRPFCAAPIILETPSERPHHFGGPRLCSQRPLNLKARQWWRHAPRGPHPRLWQVAQGHRIAAAWPPRLLVFAAAGAAA